MFFVRMRKNISRRSLCLSVSDILFRMRTKHTVCMNIITNKIKSYLLQIPHIVYHIIVICYYLYYITTIVYVTWCILGRRLYNSIIVVVVVDVVVVRPKWWVMRTKHTYYSTINHTWKDIISILTWHTWRTALGKKS